MTIRINVFRFELLTRQNLRDNKGKFQHNKQAEKHYSITKLVNREQDYN